MTKFLLDVFYDSSTSSMFYTTDLMVLIDIVTRQLTDLSQGDEVRERRGGGEGGLERERQIKIVWGRDWDVMRKGGRMGGGGEEGREVTENKAEMYVSGSLRLSFSPFIHIMCDTGPVLSKFSSTLCQVRTHNLELLYRLVGSTPYSEHKHRQSALSAALNRISHEEGIEGTKDLELVKKIRSTYPGLFEEVTDL